jgi:hypothetical protein
MSTHGLGTSLFKKNKTASNDRLRQKLGLCMSTCDIAVVPETFIARYVGQRINGGNCQWSL